jgi:UDP-glucose 4-epimerase
MKVIVTGASGFIGSHVAEALSSAGHEVTLLDRHRSPYLREDQRFVQADLLDRSKIEEAVQGHDAVYHFAGIAHLDIGLTAPIETVEQNVLGTVIALEASRLAGVQRFVYASSIYVYSEGGSFYRASKQAAELYVEEYQRRHGLDFTILRFGTVYGPRADRHNSVRRYLKQALREHKIVASGTGDEMREYVHVKDAANSSVQILDDDFRNEHIVLTGQHPMRFADLLAMIREIVGDVEIEWQPPDPTDARHGDSGHFVITPYSFRPRTARKLVANPYLDMGQGLLECLEEIYLEETGEARTLSAGAEPSHGPLDG